MYKNLYLKKGKKNSKKKNKIKIGNINVIKTK